MLDFFQEVRLGVRRLSNRPVFTIVSIITLALGIGVNSAVFTVTDAVLLRPLPFRNPHELVLLQNVNQQGIPRTFTYPMFQVLHAQQEVLSGLFSWTESQLRLEDDLEFVSVLFASSEIFSTLAISAFVGRNFDEEDTRVGRGPVAMITYRLWQQKFKSDPGVVGKTVRLEGVPITIVGVTPPEFLGLTVGQHTDFLVPVTAKEQIVPSSPTLRTRDILWLNIWGRLQKGIGIEEAASHLSVVWLRTLEETQPTRNRRNLRNTFFEQKLRLVSAKTGRSFLQNFFRSPLLILMIASIIVLIIAFINVVNLMLVNASTRNQEFAIRRAHGAKFHHLVRLTLSETIIVVILGGAAGLLLSHWGAAGLVYFLSGFYGAEVDIDLSLHNRVLVFAGSIVTFLTLVFSVLVAAKSMQADLGVSLRSVSRDDLGSKKERRLLSSPWQKSGEVTLLT